MASEDSFFLLITFSFMKIKDEFYFRCMFMTAIVATIHFGGLPNKLAADSLYKFYGRARNNWWKSMVIWQKRAVILRKSSAICRKSTVIWQKSAVILRNDFIGHYILSTMAKDIWPF